MNDEVYRQLPLRTQYAAALGLASKVMGREQVERLARQIHPLLVDRIGHGDVEPEENFWGGVWQVYRAE